MRTSRPESNNRRFLHKAPLLALVLLLPITAACSTGGGARAGGRASGTGEQSTPAGSPAPRIIWQPGDLQPFYYASSKGLWSKYGLNPTFIQVPQGTAALSALAGGSADISLIGPGPTVSGISQGVDLVVVYSLVDFSTLEGLYVNPKAGINNLHDLVGKDVAVPFGSSADTGLRFALKKAGISATQVHFKNIAPPQILSGLANGDIDAAYIWSTWGQRLLAGGAKLVFTDREGGVNAGPTLASVRRDYLKKNPQAVACFVATMNAASIGANADPATAAQGLAKYTGVTPAEGLTIAKKEHSLTISDALSPNGMFSLTNRQGGLPGLLKNVGAQLKDETLISKSPSDLTNNIDATPAKAARAIKPNGKCS